MERTFRIAPNARLFCCICIWKDEHEQVRKFIFRKKREHRFREPIRLYEKTEGAIGLIISMCTDWYLSLSYNPTLILSKPHENLKDLQRVYKKYVWIENWNGFEIYLNCSSIRFDIILLDRWRHSFRYPNSKPIPRWWTTHAIHLAYLAKIWWSRGINHRAAADLRFRRTSGWCWSAWYQGADHGRRYGGKIRGERLNGMSGRRRFKNEWRGHPTASTHILYPRRSDVTGSFLISQEVQHL